MAAELFRLHISHDYKSALRQQQRDAATIAAAAAGGLLRHTCWLGLLFIHACVSKGGFQ